MTSRSFKLAPKHAHLVRPRTGLSGEMWNLRVAVDDAFVLLEGVTRDPAATVQPDWYLSSIGDDSNDGSSIATSLRSHAELMRRVGDGEVRTNVMVHVLDNALAAEDVHARWNIGPGGTVTYKGYPTEYNIWAPVPNQFEGVTDLDPATNQPFHVECVGHMFLSDADKRRVRITSGAALGSVAWHAHNYGFPFGWQHYMSVWMPTTSQYPMPWGFWAGGWPIVGDTYIVEELPAIQSLRVETKQHIDDTGGFPWTYGRLFFEDLDIGSGNNVITVSSNHPSAVHFVNCALLNLGAGNGAGWAAWNCNIRDAYIDGPGSYFINGGLAASTFKAHNAGYLYINDLFCQACYLNVTGKTHVFVEWDNAGIGFTEATAGILLGEGASLRINGYLYGVDNGPFLDTGLIVGAGCQVLYANAARLTAGAFSQDMKIGGAVTAYGALPVVSATNNAMVVLNA